MKLRSAREAWSSAYYTPWDSISAVMAEQATLGIVEGGGYITRNRHDVDEWGRPTVHKERVFCPGVKQDRAGKRNNAGKLAEQALAGCIQRAISSLKPHIRAFGNHLYSALATADDREAAEALVWEWFEARRQYHGIRMTAAKRERAYYVTKICLHRYRRIHQGGMSAGIDPVPTPDAFRQALDDVYGIELPSSAFKREWQDIIDMTMEICSVIDKMALTPVTACLNEMKEAA